MLKEKGSLICLAIVTSQLALCCLQIDPSCDRLIYFLISCIFLCMALLILSTPNLNENQASYCIIQNLCSRLCFMVQVSGMVLRTFSLLRWLLWWCFIAFPSSPLVCSEFLEIFWSSFQCNSTHCSDFKAFTGV